MKVHLGFIRCGWFSWRWECFNDDGEECLGDDGEAGHDGAVDDELYFCKDSNQCISHCKHFCENFLHSNAQVAVTNK